MIAHLHAVALGLAMGLAASMTSGCTKAQGVALVQDLPPIATGVGCVIIGALDGLALAPLAASCGVSVEQAAADIIAIVDGGAPKAAAMGVDSTTRTKLELSLAYGQAKLAAKP